jgi:hypothetical protein
MVTEQKSTTQATAKQTKKVPAKKSTARRAAPEITSKQVSKSARAAEQPVKIDAEARYRMIAELAYSKAEKRGFENGSPVDDWLAAEREVDATLMAQRKGKA